MFPTSQSMSESTFSYSSTPTYSFSNSVGFNFNNSINLSPYYFYKPNLSCVKPQQSPSYNYFNFPETPSQFVLLSPLKIEQKRSQLIENMNNYHLKVPNEENNIILQNHYLMLPSIPSSITSIKKISTFEEVYLENRKISKPSIRITMPDPSIQLNEPSNIYIKSENQIQDITNNFRDETPVKNRINNFSKDINDIHNQIQIPISQSLNKIKSEKKQKLIDEFAQGKLSKINNPYITKPRRGRILNVSIPNTYINKSYPLKASKTKKDLQIQNSTCCKINSVNSVDSFNESLPSKIEESSLGDSKSINITPNNFGNAVREVEEKFDNCRQNNLEEVNFEFEISDLTKKSSQDELPCGLKTNIMVEEEQKKYNFFGEI